jgi:DNA-binding MarR family transcriptional regulator
LKDYLSLNASTVSGIIKRLEVKGLVAKLPKTNDKRTNPIILTENGNIIVKKSSKSLHEIFLVEIKDISDEKFNKLISSIELINSILNTEKIDAAPIFTGKVE